MVSRDERQKECIQKWIQSGCRSTIEAATGFGKTRIALIAIKAYLKKNTAPILIVVPTEHLKIQWMGILNKEGLLLNCNVMIINSVINKTYIPTGLLILDELHRSASVTFINVFKVTKPSMILGLTATFERIDGRDDLLNQYCPVVDTVTIKEAIENKWLAPYKEYKVLIDVDLKEYQEHHSKFLSAFAFFEFNFETSMKCVTDIVFRRTYAKRMGYEDKEVAAKAFMWNTALRKRKEFVLNHPIKLEIAKQILRARPNSKAITFNSTIKQCESYGFGYVVHSKGTKKKNRLTMDEFALMSRGVLHSSKSLNEGADIPGLNLAVITSNSSSKTSKIQRIGRVVRFEEGKEAEVFTLVLKGTMEESWFSNSTSGQSFIEISDIELEDILNNKEIENRKEEIAEGRLDMLRF